MKHYRGILLDADNTLFDYDAAEAGALDDTFAAFLPEAPPGRAREAYRAINARWWASLERGNCTMEELKPGRFRDLLLTMGVKGDAAEIASFYLARLGAAAILLPGAAEAVEALARHARLSLVTNGISSVQRSRLEASGLRPFFAAVLISEELGIAKPDPRFFRAACEALALPPSEVLCVGDNPVADVAGAMSAGIDACWINPAGRPWPGPGPAPLFVARDMPAAVNFASGVFP